MSFQTLIQTETRKDLHQRIDDVIVQKINLSRRKWLLLSFHLSHLTTRFINDVYGKKNHVQVALIAS